MNTLYSFISQTQKIGSLIPELTKIEERLKYICFDTTIIAKEE